MSNHLSSSIDFDRAKARLEANPDWEVKEVDADSLWLRYAPTGDRVAVYRQDGPGNLCTESNSSVETIIRLEAAIGSETFLDLVGSSYGERHYWYELSGLDEESYPPLRERVLTDTDRPVPVLTVMANNMHVYVSLTDDWRETLAKWGADCDEQWANVVANAVDELADKVGGGIEPGSMQLIARIIKLLQDSHDERLQDFNERFKDFKPPTGIESDDFLKHLEEMKNADDNELKGGD